MGIIERLFGRRRPAPSASPYAERQARDDADIARLLDGTLTRESRCIDVGAHTGDFLDRFLERAPDGRHLAIEPIPALAERLRDAYPGVHVEWCVLGDRDGETRFFVQIDRPAWSSLAEEHAPESGSRVEPVDVPMRRLDDLADGADFLKIDVEGAELGVLRGAPRLLATEVIVLFEHAHLHADHFGTTPGDVWDELAGYQRQLYSVDGRGPHSREEFVRICAASRDAGYGAEAETNFVSRLT